MTITTNLNGTVLEIAPEGRLDTMTAPELEAELRRSMDGAESLIMDFSRLDYISSAGLRVLLVAQKTMNKAGAEMTIANVIPPVKEVFEITGFTNIFTLV